MTTKNSVTEKLRVFVLLTGLLCITALIQAAGSRHGQKEPEKIYTSREVDTKAVLKKQREHPTGNCGQLGTECSRQGTVKLQIVLHKTRKVTEVKVIEDDKCSDFVERACKIAKKIEFTPAIKEGVEVSQYLTI